MKNIHIPEKELRYLYLKQEMSSNKLAKRYGCCKATILKKLHKDCIKLRPPGVKRLSLGGDELKKLYIDKKMSTWKIAELIGCGRSTIHRKLKEFDIKTRDIAISHVKYNRKPFSNNPKEMAYLIGFAIGDLRVRKVGKKSKTIKTDCGSTKKEQIDLIKLLFDPYGRVWISKPNKYGKIQIEAYLDHTFHFLLKPKIYLKQIFSNKKLFLPFLAGFIDAEGSFYLTSKKSRFSIGNYDSDLLEKIRKNLLKYGIDAPQIYKDKKLYTNSEGYKRKCYYWHLFVNKKESIIKLSDLISPFIKHEKRKRDMKLVVENILISKGEVK